MSPPFLQRAAVKTNEFLSNMMCTCKRDWQASHTRQLYTNTIGQLEAVSCFVLQLTGLPRRPSHCNSIRILMQIVKLQSSESVYQPIEQELLKTPLLPRCAWCATIMTQREKRHLRLACRQCLSSCQLQLTLLWHPMRRLGKQHARSEEHAHR